MFESMGAGTMANLGMGVLGGVLNAVGQSKRSKAAKSIYDRLGKTNDAYLTDLYSVRDRLGDMPAPEFDDTYLNQMMSDSRSGLVDAQSGRVSGEEMAKDSVRQTTADAIGRAKNTSSNSMDLLSFVASQSDAERKAMNSIDAQLSSEKRASISAARDRIRAAQDRRIQFDQMRDSAINNYELMKFNNQIDMDRFIAGTQNQLSKEELAQYGAWKDSQAAIWTGVSQSLFDVGNSMQQGQMTQSYINSMG